MNHGLLVCPRIGFPAGYDGHRTQSQNLAPGLFHSPRPVGRRDRDSPDRAIRRKVSYARRESTTRRGRTSRSSRASSSPSSRRRTVRPAQALRHDNPRARILATEDRLDREPDVLLREERPAGASRVGQIAEWERPAEGRSHLPSVAFAAATEAYFFFAGAAASWKTIVFPS